MKFRDCPRVRKSPKRGQYGTVLANNNKREAQKFAETVRPILMDIMLNARSKDARRPKGLAGALNAQEIPSARGGKWSRETVRRLLKRLAPDFLREFNQLRQRQVR